MPTGNLRVGGTIQEYWLTDFNRGQVRLALTALERKQKRVDQFITTTNFGRHFGLMNFLFDHFQSLGKWSQRAGVFGMGRSASEPRELAMLLPGVVEGFDGSGKALEAATHPAPIFKINPPLLNEPAYVEYLSHLGISRERLEAHQFSYPIAREVATRVHPHPLLFGAQPVPALFQASLGLATCLHVCEHFPNRLLARLLGLEIATALEAGGMMVFDENPFAPWFLSDAEAEELGFDKPEHPHLPHISYTVMDTLSSDRYIKERPYTVYTKREKAPLAELMGLIRENIDHERQFFAERRRERRAILPLTADQVFDRLNSSDHASLLLTNRINYTVPTTAEITLRQIGIDSSDPLKSTRRYDIKMGEVTVGILFLGFDKTTMHASVEITDLSQGIGEVIHRLYWDLSQVFAREASLWRRDVHWHFRSPHEYETFAGSLALEGKENRWNPLDYVVAGRSFCPLTSFSVDPDLNEWMRLKNRYAVVAEGAFRSDMYGPLQVVHEIPEGLRTTDRNAAIAKLDGPLLIDLNYGKPTTRVISVLMHGDEPSGFQALLNYFADPLADPPANLVFIIQNPLAAQAHRRGAAFAHHYLLHPPHHQLNLNLLWYKAFNRTVDPIYHVNQIMRFLKTIGKIDGVLDIHNAASGPPHLIVTQHDTCPHRETSQRLARYLSEEAGVEIRTSSSLQTFRDALGTKAPSVTLEAPPYFLPDADSFAEKVLRRFVRAPAHYHEPSGGGSHRSHGRHRGPESVHHGEGAHAVTATVNGMAASGIAKVAGVSVEVVAKMGY